MPQAVIDATPDWKLLNSSAATGVFIQNLGGGVAEIARHASDSVAPGEDPPRMKLAPGEVVDGTMEEVFRGGAGDYIWARCVTTAKMSVGWSV